jgi:dodecin
MSVARATEITATSPEGFEDVIKQGIAPARKTLRGISRAWLKEQNVMIDNGAISSYRVNLLITSVLED